MKTFNTKKQQELLETRKAFQRGQQELYLARTKHRQMKRMFKGIMPYQQRKILYKIGVRKGND